MPRRTLRRRAGFTLAELLTVVAIITISAALAAPTLSSAMSQRRTNEAVYSVVRLGALARSEAMAYGRAHVLLFAELSGGTGGTNGRLELWRGTVNRCASNNWAAIISGTCATSNNCIQGVDMDSWSTGNYGVQMRLDGAAAAQLCYQPDGELLISTGGLFISTPPAGTDAVRFRFNRLAAGAPTGVPRAALFPFGGVPRVER